MASVLFQKGLLQNIPQTYTEGTFYVATDERGLYLDVSNSARIRFGDIQIYSSMTALQANPEPSETVIYYVIQENCLARYNGSAYITISMDTGATSVTVTGNGNVITTAGYNPTTRTITLTKGMTAVTESDVLTLISNDNTHAPTSHASTATTYGTGTSSSYGHVKLSDATDGTSAAASGGTAATPKAVNDALVAAKAYADTVAGGTLVTMNTWTLSS